MHALTEQKMHYRPWIFFYHSSLDLPLEYFSQLWNVKISITKFSSKCKGNFCWLLIRKKTNEIRMNIDEKTNCSFSNDFFSKEQHMLLFDKTFPQLLLCLNLSIREETRTFITMVMVLLPAWYHASFVCPCCYSHGHIMCVYFSHSLLIILFNWI
jgi:hypothetical protein